MGKILNVLSLDFDFWVRDDPNYDFGHNEDLRINHILWSIRASQFLARGKDIEKIVRIEPSEISPQNFYTHLVKKHVDITESEILSTDSHARIVDFLKSHKKINLVHIDAHHDFGYSDQQDRINCGNWVQFLVNQKKISKIHLIYPKWRDGYLLDFDLNPEVKLRIEEWRKKYKIPVTISFGLENLNPFKVNKFFMCRSGAWVPPWLDLHFFNILSKCSAHCKKTFSLQNLEVRTIDWENIKNLAQQERELLNLKD